jgi:hypothetical protein
MNPRRCHVSSLWLVELAVLGRRTVMAFASGSVRCVCGGVRLQRTPAGGWGSFATTKLR